MKKSKKRTTHSRQIISKKRDIQILFYIWKWKLATTNMIYYKLYQGFAVRTAYSRLYRLKRSGYLKVHRGDSFAAWTLSKQGFQLLKSYLDDLKEVGYKSEAPIHDLITALIHQGETLIKPTKDIEFVTEQQLRRIEPHILEDWIPSPDHHRPDGYWRFSKQLIASIEVETSTKNNTYLDEIMHFYGNTPEVDRVIWVVTSASYGKRILKHEKKNLCANGEKHNIILLKDSLDNLWNCKILLGPEAGMTLRDFILKDPTKTPQQSVKQVCYDYLLDTSLMPRNNSDPRNKLEFAICV